MTRHDERNASEAGGGAARADEAAAAADGSHQTLRDRQEALLDEAVQETFPASDPVAVVRLL